MLQGVDLIRCHPMVWMVCALLLSCSPDRRDAGAIRPSGSQTAASSTQDPPPEPPRRSIRQVASVIDLLVRPERYDGKLVRVAGALSSDARGIFVTAEHAKLGLIPYGLALRPGACTGPDSHEPPSADPLGYGGSYVWVEAEFSSEVTGEMGQFKAALCGVTAIAVASPTEVQGKAR